MKTSIHPTERRALRVLDACSCYGISRSTIYKMLNDGSLPSVKIGGRRVIPRDALEAILAGKEARA